MNTTRLTSKIALLAVVLVSSPIYAQVSFYDLPDGLRAPRGLTEGPDGNFYGTTGLGGTYGSGTVFKMTPDGQFTVLVSLSGSDGAYPSATPSGLTLVNGEFYGVTGLGGDYNEGAAYKITTNGVMTVLHSFDTNNAPGRFPNAKLALGVDGYLYGSTAAGSIFKMTLDGAVTTVASGSVTGWTLGLDGALYGLDVGGGIYNDNAYRLTADGTLSLLTTNIPSYVQFSGLFLGNDGNFYGTSRWGGQPTLFSFKPSNGGSVFKMTPSGVVTIVAAFDFATAPDGMAPVNTTGSMPLYGVVQAPDDSFYGTTWLGGAYGNGTVFQATAGGQIVPVFSLQNGDSGPLTVGSDGNIYGVLGSTNATATAHVVARTVKSTSVRNVVFKINTHVLAGKYNGLFAETNGAGDSVVNVASAGMLNNLNVNAAGSFSGKVFLAGRNYNLSGTFDNAGHATATVLGAPLNVTMDLDTKTGTITGTVAEASGAWTATLRANRGVTAKKGHPIVYTALIPSSDPTGVTSAPGAGFETIKNANGSVSFSGALGDGATASASPVPIAANGDIPLYVSLYKGKGVLYGWINLSSSATGTLDWIASANADALYPAGFTNRDIVIKSSPWAKPRGVPIPVTASTLTFSGAGITPLTFVVSGAVAHGNCLSVVSANNTGTLHASINPNTGAVTLQVRNAVAGNTLIGKGALLQNTTNLEGAFVVNGKAGALTLTP